MILSSNLMIDTIRLLVSSVNFLPVLIFLFGKGIDPAYLYRASKQGHSDRLYQVQPWSLTAYLQIELTGGVKLCGFLLFLEFFVFFPESLDSTRGVDKFLFTGKKRMTFGADFNTDIRFGRTDLYLIAACTSYARFIVFRMNSVFHVIYNPLYSNNE